MRTISKWIGASLVGLISVGAIYQTLSDWRDARKYPAPGKRVDVGGHQLHIDSTGSGTPTVVLDSGLSHGAIVWSLVQPEVAKFARVCSYDRAGYGWSDAGPKPRTSRQAVRELHTLLHNAEIPGPYVLVGHSLGGLNVRLYAREYPQEVAGIVLVDASHEDQGARMPRSPFRERMVQELQWQWFRLNPLWARLGLLRLWNRPSGVIEELPPALQKMAIAIGLKAGAYDWIFGEAYAIDESISQMRDVGELGNLPLAVLSAQIPDPGVDACWQQMQRELAQLSSNCAHVIAESGGHNLHIDEPDLVIDTIWQLVETVRNTA